MATYTTNLVIELIGTGELAGTWGTTTNQNFQYVFEEAIVGRAGVAFSDANVTLTTTQATTDQTFRNVYLNCTGTNTAQRSLIVPTINKNYIVENNTTGGFAILVTTSGGTGLVVPNGYKAALYVDGTNVVTAFNYLSSLTVAGSLTTGSYVANGSITSSAYIGAYSYGTLTYLDTNNFATYQTSANSYAQVVLQNTSTGTAASADVIVSNNLGTASNYYGDFGINGSGFSGSGNFQAPNNVYLYSIGSDLAIGTQSSNAIHFIVGGATAADALILDSNQNLGLGITPPSNSQSNGGLYIGSYASYAANTSTNATTVGQNVYYLSTTPVYRNTGYAALYQQTTSGVHSWLVAPSGTANSSSVTSGLGYIVASLGTTTLAQWQAYFSGLSTIPTVGQAITATATGSIAGGATVTAQVVFNQAMTLTNAGYLGIGTSSPTSYLTVNGGSTAPTSNPVVRIDSTATTTYSTNTYVGGQIRINFGNATSSYGGINFSNFGATSQDFFGVVQNSSGYDDFVWQTYNATFGGYAENMRLNNAGNLGLGVTPSAWISTFKAIQIGNGASVQGQTNSVSIVHVSGNAYVDSGGTYRYIGTGEAAQRYQQYSGAHSWYTAASGTAGNAITFTQVMTLTSSGQLGIGTSSPSHLLTVNQGSSSTTGLLISGNSSPGLNITETSSSNNLFLGADSSAIYVSAQTSTPLVFRTNSTEYMRLDTSGNLLVGTTSIGTLTGNSFFAAPVSGGANIGITHSSGTSSGQNYAGFLYNGTTIGSITQSGTTSVNFNGNSVPPSDQRLKENIVDAPSAQTFLNNIKVRSFDWIADKTHQTYGMIAQELMTVAPEVVPTPPDENTMMGIDYAKLVPALIKCVQELSAKVTALEAKVGA